MGIKWAHDESAYNEFIIRLVDFSNWCYWSALWLVEILDYSRILSTHVRFSISELKFKDNKIFLRTVEKAVIGSRKTDIKAANSTRKYESGRWASRWCLCGYSLQPVGPQPIGPIVCRSIKTSDVFAESDLCPPKWPMFLKYGNTHEKVFVRFSAHHLQSDLLELRNVLISLLDRLFFEKWVERVRKSEHFASPVN